MIILYYSMLFLFLLFCPCLCFVILIQESKSSGLGTAFGGSDASSSVFGTSTPEVLKKVTAYLSMIFMVGCVVLSIWTNILGAPKEKGIQEHVEIES